MAKTNRKQKQSEENTNGNNLDFMVDDLEIDASAEQNSESKSRHKSKASKSDKDNGIVISKQKFSLIKQMLENIKENNEKLLELVSVFISPEQLEQISIGQMSDEAFTASTNDTEEGRIIEGVFDGENMIGPDGKHYSVPANYASKSKLVEGDILKLTITANGTFVYKQIGPIDRRRVVGKLEQSIDGNFQVSANGKKWRVITASVTYFKGQAGDEVVILVPKTGDSKWAAVENIVKKTG